MMTNKEIFALFLSCCGVALLWWVVGSVLTSEMVGVFGWCSDVDSGYFPIKVDMFCD